MAKQTSMYDFMLRIEKLLIKDEALMRLLVYPPEGWDYENKKEIYDPLDERLPNIVGSKDYQKLKNERFRKGTKTTDINKDAKVIVYMSEGRRRPVFGNYLLATQEIKFDIYVHEDYESDFRISRIVDRLTYLLTHEHISGIGKTELGNGNDKDAPTGYRGYQQRFLFTLFSKGVNEYGV